MKLVTNTLPLQWMPKVFLLFVMISFTQSRKKHIRVGKCFAIYMWPSSTSSSTHNRLYRSFFYSSKYAIFPMNRDCVLTVDYIHSVHLVIEYVNEMVQNKRRTLCAAKIEHTYSSSAASILVGDWRCQMSKLWVIRNKK